jgi:hypothetical protein
MCKPLTLLAMAPALGVALLAAAGEVHSPPGILQATRVLLCNEAGEPFEIAVDAERYRALPRRGCKVFEMSPGDHVLTPRGDPKGGPWFASAAWSVTIPPEGAILRFGLRASVVDLLEILAGFPDGPPPRPEVPAAEPFYMAGAVGVPLATWYVCGPDHPLRILLDGVHVFTLLPGACGSLLAPVGNHRLGCTDLAGVPYGPAQDGYLPPGGDHIFMPGPRLTPPSGPHTVRLLPPTARLRRLRPEVRTLPKLALRPLAAEIARRARIAAIRGRPVLLPPSSRLPRPVAPSLAPRAPRSSPLAQEWARVRRSASGWVVGPGDDLRRWRTVPRVARASRARHTAGTYRAPRYAPRGAWSRPAARYAPRGTWSRPAPRTVARAWSRPAPRRFTYSTSSRGWSRPAPTFSSGFRGGASGWARRSPSYPSSFRAGGSAGRSSGYARGGGRSR